MSPADKGICGTSPPCMAAPDKQTVGGAVVSFLLRPCAFSGLVVFGKRSGISPTFTSYKNWTGQMLKADENASKQLVRSYLHCYGPSNVDGFVNWLGCSGKQEDVYGTWFPEEMGLPRWLGKSPLSCLMTGKCFSPPSLTGK